LFSYLFESQLGTTRCGAARRNAARRNAARKENGNHGGNCYACALYSDIEANIEDPTTLMSEPWKLLKTVNAVKIRILRAEQRKLPINAIFFRNFGVLRIELSKYCFVTVTLLRSVLLYTLRVLFHLLYDTFNISPLDDLNF